MELIFDEDYVIKSICMCTNTFTYRRRVVSLARAVKNNSDQACIRTTRALGGELTACQWAMFALLSLCEVGVVVYIYSLAIQPDIRECNDLIDGFY